MTIKSREFHYCHVNKINETNWVYPPPLSLEEWMAEFDDHQERSSKDGYCIVPGVIEKDKFGKRRCEADAISRIDALIYDIDGNQSLASVLALAKKWGLKCIVYTTHSHKTTRTELDADKVMNWVRKNFSGVNEPEELTRAHVEAYLRAHNKAHLLTAGFDFPAQFDPNDERFYCSRNEENRAVIIVHHDPIDKYRVVFPLPRPILIDKLGFTNKERIAKFRQILMSVGRALGLNFDPSCTDPSRRFYLPSHRPGAEFLTQRFDGELLDWEDEERFPRIVSEPKSTKSSHRGNEGGETDYKAVRDKYGKAINLFETCVEGFDIEGLLAGCLPDEMVRSDRSNGSGFHVECAFESEHTNEGGTGTFCTNDNGNGHWNIYCCHTCKERHGDRLAYLAEYIRAGYITAEDIIRAMPEKPDFEALIDEALLALAAVDKAKEPKLWTQKKLAVFDLITDSDLSIDEQDAWLHKVCAAIKAKATACNTEIKPDFKRYRKEKHSEKMSAKQARRAEGSATAGKVTFANSQSRPFTDVAQELHAAFHRANEANPHVFNVAVGLVRTEQNAEKGRIEAHECTKDVFGHELNKVADFFWINDNGDFNHDAVPEKFVKYLFNAPPEVQKLPFLKSIAYAPTFAADGSLINKPGFYRESGHLYAPPASMQPVREVAAVPTDADVTLARALLMEAFWDFPFNDGEEVPHEWFGTDDPVVKLSIGKASRANTIAKLLLFFAREMIPGNKPLFSVDKPTSRIGSQLMAKVVNLITSGDDPPNVQVPTNDEEWTKTALTYLLARVCYIVFDNVVHTVKGAMLASMLTGKISGRMLGVNKAVDGTWNATTEVNGINLVFDREIAERTIYTLLDPRMKDPTKRTSYRHSDLEDWVKKNRSDLIWACLVIVQNWIAKGKPLMNDPKRTLAGFEPYCRIMGGILDAAGIEGFNTNRNLIRVDSKFDDLDAFISEWLEVFGTSTVIPGNLDDYALRDVERRASGSATSLAILLLDMSDECDLGLFTGNSKLGSLGARLGKNVLSKALGRVFEHDGAEYVLERDGRGYRLKPQRGAPGLVRWHTTRVRPGFEDVLPSERRAT